MMLKVCVVFSLLVAFAAAKNVNSAGLSSFPASDEFAISAGRANDPGWYSPVSATTHLRYTGWHVYSQNPSVVADPKTPFVMAWTNQCQPNIDRLAPPGECALFPAYLFGGVTTTDSEADPTLAENMEFRFNHPVGWNDNPIPNSAGDTNPQHDGWGSILSLDAGPEDPIAWNNVKHMVDMGTSIWAIDQMHNLRHLDCQSSLIGGRPGQLSYSNSLSHASYWSASGYGWGTCTFTQFPLERCTAATCPISSIAVGTCQASACSASSCTPLCSTPSCNPGNPVHVSSGGFMSTTAYWKCNAAFLDENGYAFWGRAASQGFGPSSGCTCEWFPITPDIPSGSALISLANADDSMWAVALTNGTYTIITSNNWNNWGGCAYTGAGSECFNWFAPSNPSYQAAYWQAVPWNVEGVDPIYIDAVDAATNLVFVVGNDANVYQYNSDNSNSTWSQVNLGVDDKINPATGGAYGTRITVNVIAAPSCPAASPGCIVSSISDADFSVGPDAIYLTANNGAGQTIYRLTV